MQRLANHIETLLYTVAIQLYILAVYYISPVVPEVFLVLMFIPLAIWFRVIDIAKVRGLRFAPIAWAVFIFPPLFTTLWFVTSDTFTFLVTTAPMLYALFVAAFCTDASLAAIEWGTRKDQEFYKGLQEISDDLHKVLSDPTLLFPKWDRVKELAVLDSPIKYFEIEHVPRVRIIGKSSFNMIIKKYIGDDIDRLIIFRRSTVTGFVLCMFGYLYLMFLPFHFLPFVLHPFLALMLVVAWIIAVSALILVILLIGFLNVGWASSRILYLKNLANGLDITTLSYDEALTLKLPARIHANAQIS